jgi:hypothetical protein
VARCTWVAAFHGSSSPGPSGANRPVVLGRLCFRAFLYRSRLSFASFQDIGYQAGQTFSGDDPRNLRRSPPNSFRRFQPFGDRFAAAPRQCRMSSFSSCHKARRRKHATTCSIGVSSP